MKMRKKIHNTLPVRCLQNMPLANDSWSRQPPGPIPVQLQIYDPVEFLLVL